MTDPAAGVQAWLEPRAEEMAALLERLVAIDTENPPGRGLGRCGRVLHEAMERLGLAPELIELAPSRELEDPCLVRGAAGTGARTIYFHGHFDVVPAQDPAQFRPQRSAGRITGRGTADMKGGLVSMLYGAVAARELGLLGDRRIVLHLVCDEETGSEAGSGHLRAAGMIDADALAMVTRRADRRRRLERVPRRDHAAGRPCAAARPTSARRSSVSTPSSTWSRSPRRSARWRASSPLRS